MSCRLGVRGRWKLGARERIESADAKWLNYIMDREALRKFLHPEQVEPEPAA